MVEWDYDKSTSAKRVISDVFHSDITDAVLYAWREARHYAYESISDAPLFGSNDYMDEMERLEAEEFERKKRDKHGIQHLWDLNKKSFWEQ